MALLNDIGSPMKIYWVDLPLSWWDRIDVPVEGPFGFSYWELKYVYRCAIRECGGQYNIDFSHKPEDGIRIIFPDDEAYVKFRLCYLPVESKQ